MRVIRAHDINRNDAQGQIRMQLTKNLTLNRCPHCAVASPMLNAVHNFETKDQTGIRSRIWQIYACRTCGGVVSAWAPAINASVSEWFPSMPEVDAEVPDRPRVYLQQAQESLHAPAGALMLCASSVDSMLKIKGYAEGSLHARIEKAVSDHLITPEMATWAHEVRLDANDQRHADEGASLPSQQDATRAIEFSMALAEFLFVLPGRVQRGIKAGR